MAKSARARKLKKAEKAKVKFKVGKPRPKGLNVTDTSFKSKKILLQEQLKSTTDPTTKRHLNLNDLLSHLGHYNMSMRISGLTGLQELLTSNPGLLQRHLGSILEKAAPLFIDKESSVRSQTVSLLHSIFTKVSSNHVAPHFSAMSAHLCCAMTHIIPEIQQDSLRIVDLLLDFYPHFVIAESDAILKNFLEQISKHSGIKGRTLTVNPGNKLTSHTWRIKILNQIKKLIGQILLSKKIDGKEILEEVSYKWVSNQREAWVFPQERCYLLPSLILDVSGKRKKNNECHEGEQPRKIISSLMPLIYQTWIEVLPQKQGKTQSQDSVLSEDCIVTLSCATDIMKKLWFLIDTVEREDIRSDLKKWYLASYGEEFAKYFCGFPFSPMDGLSHRKGKKKNLNFESLITVANLDLCLLFIKFRRRNTGTILQYISSVVSAGGNFNLSETVEVLEAVIKLPITEEDRGTALEAAYNIYTKLHPMQKDRQLINKLFINAIMDGNSKSPAITKWAKSLPEQLLQEAAPVSVLLTMQRLACIKNQDFIAVLQDNFLKILENLLKIRWSRGSNAETCHRNFLSLLYWIPEFLAENRKAVEEFLESETISEGNRQYLYQLLLDT